MELTFCLVWLMTLCVVPMKTNYSFLPGYSVLLSVNNFINPMLFDGPHSRTILLFWAFSDYVSMRL
jgi:hypothetical protein